VWTLLHAYQAQLDRAGTYDSNDVLSAALDAVRRGAVDRRWSAVLVDEVQDLSLLGLRLCRELAGDGTDALFLVGDGQQSLYPGGFTLADAGISVAGRAIVLRTNYRNTRPILDSARALIAHRDFTDLDSTTEPGHQAVDVLRDGPPVELERAPTARGLVALLRLAMRRHAQAGIHWGEMAVLCHTNQHVDYIMRRLTDIGIPLSLLDEWDGEPDPNAKIGTIHRSKGLDFAAVYLPDLDIPRADYTGDDATDAALEAAAPDSEWERGWTQREYVARTRARDRLWLGRLQPAFQL
jgi:superfamily I DNA/RNA helicase